MDDTPHFTSNKRKLFETVSDARITLKLIGIIFDVYICIYMEYISGEKFFVSLNESKSLNNMVYIIEDRYTFII